MKACCRCGETRWLTRHHVYPKDNMVSTPKQHATSPKIILCRACHDKEHGIVYTEKILERIIKRAKRRIKKESSNLEFAQYQLFKIKQESIFVSPKESEQP